MPKVIKDIIDKVFDRNMSVDLYKSQYDPEMLEEQHKRVEANNRRFNLFNKRKIEKATKHLNNEMDGLLKNFIKQTKRTTTHCSCPLISPLIISCKKKDYYNILVLVII